MKKAKSVLINGRDQLLAHLPRRIHNIEKTVEEISQLQQQHDSACQAQFKTLQQAIINSGYIKLSDKEIIAKIFTGAKMYLDPRDVGLVPHLILDGDWERNITHAWLKILREGDRVIDVGANLGYFSVLAAQQTNRNCHVTLFEANPELIPYLEKTMSVNSFDQCSTIENVALGDKKEDVILNVLEDFIASSSVHSIDELNQYGHNANKLKVAREIKVKAITLDEYCEAHHIKSLDLIKMDIEGFEERAYAGMRGIVKASPRISMFIEFTKEGYKNPKKFYEQMLADFGNVYLISSNGEIIKPTDNSYGTIIDAGADWVMPIFSKQKNLESLTVVS